MIGITHLTLRHSHPNGRDSRQQQRKRERETESFPIREHHHMAQKMPVVKCEMPDSYPVIAAALITAHGTSHQMPSQLTEVARVDKVKRLSILSANTTEDWLYFKSRWWDYKTVYSRDPRETHHLDPLPGGVWG